MGSACCVAATETTITNGASREVPRYVRYSPSWSFRWDNRGRVAGEETANSFSDRVSRSGGLEIKSGTTEGTAYASEGGSPSDSSQTLTWQKSPISERNSGLLRFSSSDLSQVGNVPTEVKEPMESPAASHPSPMKLSSSTHPISSSFPYPWSSPNHLLRSPGHQLLQQVSDSHIPGHNSSPNFSITEEPSFLLPGWSNDSTVGSNRGSSDCWSLSAFCEIMANSHRERRSFDSGSLSFNRDKITRSRSRLSSPASIDVQTCGVCLKILTEKSSRGSQKIIATNELAVVAILICGHVYHAECLENMTFEINKYDPGCPVCTFGENQVLKLSEKALRAEMDLKARNKKRKNRIGRNDLCSDSGPIEGRRKSGGIEGKGLNMVSSSSTTSSSGKPFLGRHFSFGSTKESENHSIRKKAFFWSKSSKE